VYKRQPFPGATLRALGWDRTSLGKLSHGGSTGGGRAFIVKFPDGYISANGTDLSNVFVAVATNTGGGGIDVESITSDIALAAGSTWIHWLYDLY